MYCATCGTENPDGAATCRACGHALPRPLAMPYADQPHDIPTYLWQSIVCTLLCCMPFGIVAIVFAAQVVGAAGWAGEGVFAVFYGGLVAHLLVAAINFYRLIFTPASDPDP